MLLIPGVASLSYVIQGLLGGSRDPSDFLDRIAFAIPISLLAAVMEEFGWRGFALPKLLERYGALKSALIVGVGWALWHAPINYLGLSKYGMEAVPILLALLVLPIAQTVIMTWIHNSTKQSMLLMVLTHFSITSAAIIFALPHPTAMSELRIDLVLAGMLTLAATVIVLVVGGRRLARVPETDENSV